MIFKNPTEGTKIPKNNYAPMKILNEEQLDIFMKAIQREPMWHDFFYTEITTGLRLGEICGLKWSDLDENTGKLKIQRSVLTRAAAVSSRANRKRKAANARYFFRREHCIFSRRGRKTR